MIYSDENAVFDCKTTYGALIGYIPDAPYVLERSIRVYSGNVITWHRVIADYIDFVEIILKSGENAIGYALIEVYRSSVTGDAKAIVLRSILFPRIDGKYQNISEGYVKKEMEKHKNITKGGDSL